MGEPQLGGYCRLTNTVPRAAHGTIYSKRPDTRAIAAADPNNRLDMKAIFQTANVEGQPIPLKEAIPFWFAVSSPLLGLLLGLLAAWLFNWLGA